MSSPVPPHGAVSSAAANSEETLRGLSVLKGLAANTFDGLKRQTQIRRLGKDELLFSPGDTAESAFVVLTGRVRIWTVSATGAEVTLNVLGPGTLLGEIGLLDGGGRTAGASAMGTAEVLVLTRRAVFAALEQDPQLARNVIALLCDRLRWVSARMEDQALRPAPDRLARMLQHLVADYGKKSPEGIRIGIELTQGELARWTMMSRESLNKIVSRWTSDGLLTQVQLLNSVRTADDRAITAGCLFRQSSQDVGDSAPEGFPFSLSGDVGLQCQAQVARAHARDQAAAHQNSR
jgi:CRP/FNR family transcriptional regulator, cyclic AMP receptor protein